MEETTTDQLSMRCSASGESPQSLAAGNELLIPVLREELDVRKQRITTGIVRVRKIVHEREESVNETGFYTELQIERVPINKTVELPPPVRQDGATTVYSVVEEVLVITRQYLVKEEVRITPRIIESPLHQRISLRTEELVVEREDRCEAGDV